jgi:shikimate dehydrogenase
MNTYGLVGKSLSHSFSKEYFSQKFKKESISNCTYVNVELENISEFRNALKEYPDCKGLNVTIPYKKLIIPFLDEIDPIAENIGAVNTIKFLENGNLKGYNTDVIGFRNSIKPFLNLYHTRALIFGTGGASKAIAFVLKDLGIPFYYVSRSPKSKKEIRYEDLDKISIASFRFLINCTPMGTFPDVEKMIPIDVEGIGNKHLVYDLVYNPEETLLLKKAKEKGAIAVNGLSMLRIQAEESWRIWKASTTI